MTDGQLLRRASEGDETAFTCLYSRYRDAVFRFAYRMHGSVEAAEDLTQECFLAILRRPEGFRPDRGSLATYLFAAVRNLSWKRLRREGREELLDDSEVTPDLEPGRALHHLIERQEAAIVQAAVQALPPLQREVIVLFEYEGLSLADVAQVLGTDVGVVKARLHRARERLRRALRWLRAEVK